MKTYQIIYTSAEKTKSGGSGFGIRTATAGTPADFLKSVAEDKSVTSYSAGKFKMKDENGNDLLNEGKALMESSGEKILEFPKTYYYKSLKIGEKQVFAVGRSVYTCFDYPFYRIGNATRPGNYVAHTFLFDGYPGKKVFNLLTTGVSELKESPEQPGQPGQTKQSGQICFIPGNWRPVVNNAELKSLMLGEPEEIPATEEELRFPELSGKWDALSLDLFFAYREAMRAGKPVVVSMKEADTAVTIARFMNLLPDALAQKTTFITNHQRVGHSQDVQITFINEYYSYEVSPAICTHLDFIKGERTVGKVEKVWRPVLEQALKDGNDAKVLSLSEWIFSKMAIENAGKSAGLNEALFDYVHNSEAFTIDTVNSVEGILEALGKYAKDKSLTPEHLNALLIKASDEAADQAAFGKVIELSEKAFKVELDMSAAKDCLKKVYTDYLLKSGTIFYDGFNALKENLFRKYTDDARYPELKAILPELLSAGAVKAQHKEQQDEQQNGMKGSKEQLKVFAGYLEPEAKTRVEIYLELLKKYPEAVTDYSVLLDFDKSEAEKIDYIGTYSDRKADPGFAGLFYNQIKRESIKAEPLEFLGRIYGLSEANPAFTKLILDDRHLYVSLYDAVKKSVDKDNRQKVSNAIADYVLTVIPDDDSIRNKWSLLKEVLDGNVPQTKKEVLSYYLMAKEVRQFEALKKVAPMCFEVLERDDIKEFVDIVADNGLMSDAELVEHALSKKSIHHLSYILAAAKKYGYDFARIEELVSKSGRDEKEVGEIIKKNFPELYKAHKKEKFWASVKGIFSKTHIFLLKLFIVSVGLQLSLSAFAAEYGDYKSNCDIRYYVTSGIVKVHSEPNVKSSVVKTVKAGDYIYVYDDKLHYDGDDAWVKISGAEQYIAAHLLTIDDNPNYIPADWGEKLETKKSVFKFGTYGLPKWLVITMLCVWVLMSSAVFWFRGFGHLFMWTVRYCPKKDHLLDKVRKLRGTEREQFIKENHISFDELFPEYGYGMPKILFFSKTPYIFCLRIAAILLTTFIATVLLFIIIGGLVWLLTWIGNILLIGLFWIFAVGGYIAGGVLLIMLFGDNDGKFWIFLGAAGCIFLAAFVGNFRWDVYDWAETLRGWGSAVFGTFNVFKVAVYIVKTYWLTALLIAVAPLVIFSSLAVVFMIFAGALILYENIVLRRYNVSHPCPYCGEHSEPAVYLSHGRPLYVPLKPGIWGMFHIKHPVTGEKMPTLFLNGKDRLERRCVHCDNLISAKIGAEKHVAVAGVPNSGKTTLLYRMISELCSKTVSGKNICSFTDDMGEDEISAKSFLKSIEGGKKMEYFPDKTAVVKHKSIQMLAQNPSGGLPYRLYINDIAGEMFTTESNAYQDAPFFRNTNVLLFVVDPFTMRADDLDFSPEFGRWYGENVGDKKDLGGKVDLDEAFATLSNTLDKYKTEKDMSKIKLMMTFVKTDTGYLDGIEASDSDTLKVFAKEAMGLESVISKLESKGFRITYHAVSASDASLVSDISSFTDEVLDNLGISYKKSSAKVQDITVISSRDDEYEKRESKRYEKFKPVNPFQNHWYKGVFTISMSYILAGLVLTCSLLISDKVHRRNYETVTAELQALSGNQMNYDGVMSLIKTTMAEKSLGEKAKEELTAEYMKTDREKRKHISRLRSTLYANFESSRGRLSNFEISLKYKALDNVKKIRTYLDEFEVLAPEDKDYRKYRKTFDAMLEKYNISL